MLVGVSLLAVAGPHAGRDGALRRRNLTAGALFVPNLVLAQRARAISTSAASRQSAPAPVVAGRRGTVLLGLAGTAVCSCCLLPAACASRWLFAGIIAVLVLLVAALTSSYGATSRRPRVSIFRSRGSGSCTIGRTARGLRRRRASGRQHSAVSDQRAPRLSDIHLSFAGLA